MLYIMLQVESTVGVKFKSSLNVLNSKLWNKCITKKYHWGESGVVNFHR